MKLVSTGSLRKKALASKGKVSKVIVGNGFKEEYVVKAHKEMVVIKQANPWGERMVVFSKKF